MPAPPNILPQDFLLQIHQSGTAFLSPQVGVGVIRSVKDPMMSDNFPQATGRPIRSPGKRAGSREEHMEP